MYLFNQKKQNMNDLLAAYQSTRYKTFDLPIVIEIGMVCPALDDLLSQYGLSTWAFITAWNPFSRVLSDAENNHRHTCLKEAVRQYKFFEGEGVGAASTWPPERSLLILGIAKDVAVEIGRKYEQNAIVIGKIYQPAELLQLVAGYE